MVKLLFTGKNKQKLLIMVVVVLLARFLVFLGSHPVTLWTMKQVPFATTSAKKRRTCPTVCSKIEPIFFNSNITNDLLDPLNGPLAFLNSNREEDEEELEEGNNNNNNNSSCPCRPRPLDAVMAFVDTTYLDTLSVWLHYYQQLDHSRRILCLFTLSDAAFHKMQHLIMSSNNISRNNSTNNSDHWGEKFGRIVVINAKLPMGGKHGDVSTNSIWAYRAMVLSDFLQTFPSLNFLFTDLDALWLRDPRQYLSSPSSTSSPSSEDEKSSTTTTAAADIVASRAPFPFWCPLLRQSVEKHQLVQGDVEKDDGTEDIGGSACFGFIYFRNTPATRRLAAVLARKAADPSIRFDDQAHFNCLLYESYNLVSSSAAPNNQVGSFLLRYNLPAAAAAELASSSSIIVNTTTTTTSRSTEHHHDDDTTTNSSRFLGIRLLSESTAVRHCRSHNQSFLHQAAVVHCNGEKRGGAKMLGFRQYGLLPKNVTMYEW